jgi:hypothetical protein
MKKKYFTVLFLILVKYTLGQTPTIVWNKAFVFSELEQSFKTIELKDSTFITVGYSNTFANNGSQILIANFNKQGEKNWQKLLFTNSYNLPQDIVTDSYDNIYVAIASTSGLYGDKSQAGYGNYDYWIIKFDKFGNKVWDKTFGGTNNDLPESISVGTDNKIYISGTSNSIISGNKSAQIFGNADFWVLKIDQDGNKIWDKSFGGGGSDSCSDHIEVNGIIYLSGHSQTIDNQSSFENIGNSDLWIMGIDHTGSLVFGRTILGFGSDYSSCIYDAKDGNLIIGAQSGSSIGYDKSQTNFGGLDFWIIKMSPDGNIIWDKTFGGNESDAIRDIIVDSQQNIYAFGNTDSNISGNKLSFLRGWRDYWLIKINSSGTKIWEGTYGSNSLEEAGNIILSSDNNLYLTGESAGKNSFDVTWITRNTDCWILKVKECLPIQEPIPITDTVNLGRRKSIFNSSCSGKTVWFNSNLSQVSESNPFLTPPVYNNLQYYIKCKIDGCQSSNFVTVNLTKKCPFNYIIDQSESPEGNYYSKDYIKINRSVETNSSLNSNGYIILEPGFKTNLGIIFSSQINGCNN